MSSERMLDIGVAPHAPASRVSFTRQASCGQLWRGCRDWAGGSFFNRCHVDKKPSVSAWLLSTAACSRMSLCVFLVVLVAACGAAARVVNEKGCPEVDYAYAFQSVCQEPATFGTAYHLVSPFSNAQVAQGGFTPDQQNFLYFTGNQSDEGATYVLTPVWTEEPTNITLGTGTAFNIANTDTSKILGWVYSSVQSRNLLAEIDDSTRAAVFFLQTACNVPLPCPETTGARCESYFFHILQLYAISASKYLGRTYITQGSIEERLPLLLRRSSSSSSASSIRQVVA